MKSFTKIASIAIILSVVGCEKKTQSHGEKSLANSSGIIRATLNGNPWSVDAVSLDFQDDLGKKIHILGEIFHEGSSEIHDLSIGNIALLNGKQQILNRVRWTSPDHTTAVQRQDTCVASFSAYNYDETDNIYSVLEEADNYIMLEDYTYPQVRIKGKFQLTLYRNKIDTKQQTQGLADTLRFTDGVFFAEIKGDSN